MFEKQRAPDRQVRAAYDDATVRVYQAYSPEIAEPALAAQTFVAPFKRDRMTWIKPSFRWMAYRCGYGSKPGQERVLAVDITRDGFEWALAHSTLSAHDRDRNRDPDEDQDRHPDRRAWQQQLKASPVRIQWDPERDLYHQPQNFRAVQIGLGGEAVDRYLDAWITAITDVTPVMHRIDAHLRADELHLAVKLVPHEPPYPLPPKLAGAIGAEA